MYNKKNKIMSSITIINYRGIDIYFNTNSETFDCIISDESVKESKSFSSIKKYIDDYKKTNSEFKSFYACAHPKSRFAEFNKIKVIGLRKDNRFIIEDEKGVKKQLSDYNLNDYILHFDSNDEYISKLSELEKEKDNFDSNFRKKREDIINKMKLTTLKEYKYNLI